MFEIAFKVGDTAHIYTSNPTLDTGQDTVHIDTWIARVMGTHSWTGWYMYNDDPPRTSSVTYRHSGHCKGIVLWNDQHVGWLIHSIPQWPSSVPLEPVPDDVCEECHTLCFWSGDVEVLYKIEKQIDLMQARVYAGSRSQLYNPSTLAVLQRIKLDDYTDHVAKNTHWERDLYQSLGRCAVKSRASMEDTTIVKNVQTLDIQGWSAAADHGRWAVGDRWVCVGDVRRGVSEFPFGGGCIVRYDDALVRTLRKLILE